MLYTIFTITVSILVAGLLVSGYFLYLFRKDQLSMRRVLLTLITEMRVSKERIDLQAKAIESVRRDFSLETSINQSESMLSNAIKKAQQGASVEQLELEFGLKRSEAAILVSSHGNLDLEAREKVNQLYMA